MASEGYNDGLLTAGEIADLNLNADFVALSACNTANFDVTQFSTDLPALTSAMAIAGVPSTLATLWPVDSESASQIVARTFELSGARDEPSSARALAASQREFLRKDMKAYNYHPRFWSPFVIFGDNKKNNTKGKIAREEPQNVKLQTLGGNGTEGLSLIKEKNEFFSRYISDIYNGRYSSSVAKLDLEGKNLWKSSSKEIGASKLLVKLNSAVIVGGYVSGVNESMVGIIESYDHKEGKLLKTFSIKSDQGLNIFAASALRISADVAYISFIENGVGISKPTGTPIVRIISVDRDFRIREIAKIDLPNELLSGLLDTNMSLNPDGGIVISVNNRMPYNFDFRVKRLDEFWSIPCMPQPKTYLYGFSKDMRLKNTSVLDGINIEKIILNDDKIIVAGSRKYECTKDAKGFIIVFTCNTCPYAVLYEDRIEALNKKYAPQGYPVIAIMPNNVETKPGDSMLSMQQRANDKEFTFPYLIDADQEIYPQYGATKTPHVFVLESTSRGPLVRYIGGIDDNYKDASLVKTRYVEEAIESLKNGYEIKQTKTKAIGCSIKL